jgi:uncharacterized MAPEG superfamily protein
MTAPLPIELVILALSVLLLFLHIGLQGMLATRERGSAWNAGPRDSEMPALSQLAGRADRALANFKETYPAFIAAVLIVVIAGRTGFWSELGVWLWLAARLGYIPLYLAGTPYIRSLVWMVSAAGIFCILAELL